MISAGARLGVYEILGPLATEGRRPIYAARLATEPDGDARLFVVKMLPGGSDASRPRDRIAELLHEVSSLSGVDGLIPVRGVFEVGQEVYVVSDLVRGDTLRHLVEAGARPSRMLAVAIVRDLARMLTPVHHLGIVHGDLCPSTIFVGTDGRLNVRELGVARVTSTRGAQVGDVRGHPSYMSPERAAARIDLGPTADVYSLGLVLWELLTGEPALPGRGEREKLAAALKGEIEPPSTRVKCGRELDTIVMQALAKNPDDRYTAAEAMARDLERYVISRAPGLDVRQELASFVSRHLGTKMRAQQLLLDRWSSRRRDSNPPAPGLPPLVPRAPSRGPHAASRSYGFRQQTGDLQPSLLAELDLAVQDLGGAPEIIIEDPVFDYPGAKRPTTAQPRRTSSSPAQLGPPAIPPTEDLAANRSSDLPKPHIQHEVTKRRIAGAALLFLAFILAAGTYALTPEGNTVLEYWLRALSGH